MIEHPSLCVACFRRNFDHLAASYDRHFQTLQKQIDQLKELRVTEDGVHKLVLMAIGTDEQKIQEEEVRHTHEYAPLMAKTWRLEDELEKAKADKKVKLAAFLKHQGVFADG